LTSGDADSGRVPRTIDCELTLDLVSSCVPGDSVVVCGLVKVVAPEQGNPSVITQGFSLATATSLVCK